MPTPTLGLGVYLTYPLRKGFDFLGADVPKIGLLMVTKPFPLHSYFQSYSPLKISFDGYKLVMGVLHFSTNPKPRQ